MRPSSERARARAAGTATILLLAGGVFGVAVDRLWLSVRAPTAELTPLTAGAMAERLGLPPEEEARLGALLDSLHGELMSSVADGPEALRAVTEAAHRRIDASLPPETRPAFHSWMQEHHEEMMERMQASPTGQEQRQGND